MYLDEEMRSHFLTGKGKYFEVRYFLNVIVASGHTLVLAFLSPTKLISRRKLVTVQLPIVLIHMVRLTITSAPHPLITIPSELPRCSTQLRRPSRHGH